MDAAVRDARSVPAPCVCSPGHWYDANRKSCVTGACKVPGMPDGDKGGGYFAWQGSLFINTPCVPCANLNTTVTTGQPGWILKSGPGVTVPKAPVVVPVFPGWGSIPGASWVSVDANSGSQPGDYEYVYEFCLCASAKGPRLDITFLADNGAKIYLNNNTLVHATTGNGNFKNPPKTVTFTGTPADWVIPGTNRVRIIVANESSVTGLSASLTIRADLGACPK